MSAGFCFPNPGDLKIKAVMIGDFGKGVKTKFVGGL
jgi:hypothetical protein